MVRVSNPSISHVRSPQIMEICKTINSWLDARSHLYLSDIMSGNRDSERHNLFQRPSERNNCNARIMSTLHQISNPGFLSDNELRTSNIEDSLLRTVFLPALREAAPYLKLLGEDYGYEYCRLVLLPELAVYKLLELGLSRADAESQFVTVIIPLDEYELYGRFDTDEESEWSEDEWDQHSDVVPSDSDL